VSLQLVYQKVGSNITNLVRNKGNATLTGGVGGSWSEESNYQDLLGVKAPVIAEAMDNLLDDEDASFESGTTGNWATDSTSISVDSTDAWHGTKCLKTVREDSAENKTYLNVNSITAPGSQYTLSLRFKGTPGKPYKAYMWGNTSLFTLGTPVVADGTWQYATVTKTYDAADTATRTAGFYLAAFEPDVYYIDAIQLEQKAYATPFALNSRTATICKFATADLGLTAGQDLSIVICLKPVYDGDDGVAHTLFDCQGTDATHNRILIQKDVSNNLNFNIWDNAGNLKQCVEAVDGTDWPADTKLIIVCTRSSSGAMDAYLAGTQFGTVDSGAGTGLESTLGTYPYLGSDNAGNNHINAPILVAIFDRVLSPLEIQRISDMKTNRNGWLSPRFITNLSRLGGCVISTNNAPLSGIDELHYIA